METPPDPAARLAGWEHWEPLSLPRVDRATEYFVVEERGRSAMRADARCSASALAVSLHGVDLRTTPLLRWSWRVETGLEPHDERSRAGDDFAARVYVMFPFEPEHASWLERARHRVASALYGRELPGHALNYVWSSREPAGARWDNPSTDASRMIVVGSGELREWQTNEVDLLRDYRERFGREPPAPLGLAIMTDSDNTCADAAALFASFELASHE
jgi:hypothetical protein